MDPLKLSPLDRSDDLETPTLDRPISHDRKQNGKTKIKKPTPLRYPGGWGRTGVGYDLPPLPLKLQREITTLFTILLLYTPPNRRFAAAIVFQLR